MQPLNFCRQILKQAQDRLAHPLLSGQERRHLVHAIYLINKSEKFILPVGGKLLEDENLRALDPAETLKLPFAFMALEFLSDPDHAVSSYFGKRRVLLLRQHGLGVLCCPMDFIEEIGRWMPRGTFQFPLTGFRRDQDNGVLITVQTTQTDSGYRYLHDADVVLGFLNALACSNVHSERLNRQKTGKVKSALPFDDYRVLTIEVPSSRDRGTWAGGSHRSPREHVRRGHVRRINSERKVWINDTVVRPSGSGGGGGRLSKDYAVRPVVSNSP